MNQGDRIWSPKPFCDGVLTALVGRDKCFQVLLAGREPWRGMRMGTRSSMGLAGSAPGLGAADI